MQEFETDPCESHKSNHDKKENEPRRSYYYDDAHGYEDYEPEQDEERAGETGGKGPSRPDDRLKGIKEDS